MPIQSPIFAPAIALVLWSLLMLAWLAVTRLPAMAKAGVDLGSVVGARGVNLEGVIPDGELEIAQLHAPDGTAHAVLRDRDHPRRDGRR